MEAAVVLGTDRKTQDSPALTRASVFIAGHETAYSHAGRGRPVLVLAGDDATRLLLARTLTGVARVILPERIEGDDSTTTGSWIRGLLDGLGLEGAAVVADESRALAVLALALADPYRVDRVALLVNGDSIVAGVGIEERLESTGQRVLLLGRPAAPRTEGPAAGITDPDGGEAWIERIANHLRARDL